MCNTVKGGINDRTEACQKYNSTRQIFIDQMAIDRPGGKIIWGLEVLEKKPNCRRGKLCLRRFGIQATTYGGDILIDIEKRRENNWNFKGDHLFILRAKLRIPLSREISSKKIEKPE